MVIRAILLSICIAFNCLALEVPTEKQFPPYPDIWGYDFSDYQAVKDNIPTFDAFQMANGDYWFHIWKSGYLDQEKNRFEISENALLKFFHSSIEDIDDSKLLLILSHIPLKKRITGMSHRSIAFSNGESIKISTPNFSGKKCTSDGIVSQYLVKLDKHGNEIGKYSVLFIMPTPHKLEYNEDYSDLCGYYGRDGIVHKQIYHSITALLPLEDDTFLVFGDNNQIIRFDQNFRTKFNPKVEFKTYNGKTLTKSFIVLPYSKIERIYETLRKEERPWIQGLQDALIEYISSGKKGING